MIKHIIMELNSGLKIEPTKIVDIQHAREIFKQNGDGTCIIVCSKDSKETLRFLAHNSPNFTSVIGRRIPNNELSSIFVDKIPVDLDAKYSTPYIARQLGNTWQILDGWWSEYFGEYACKHSFNYYLVTKSKQTKNKGKYLIDKDLKYISLKRL